MIQSPDPSMIQFLLPSSRALFLAGIIAAAGTDRQLLVGTGVSIDVNVAEPADSFRRGGRVGDGVLAADVVCDVAADLIDLIERWRKKGDPSGTVSNHFQGTLGASRALFAQQTNGVNRRPVFLLKAMDSLFESGLAGIVLAIGHNENNLAL